MKVKIISGGQTGVDRAALDAALECGVDLGGWCPEGRLSEEGVIPDVYPVQELPEAGYSERTRQNIIDSDGTAIVYFGQPHGGTMQTIEFCIQSQKAYILIDAEVFSVGQAAKSVLHFIEEYSISTLNVAGPRASDEPRAYRYAKDVIVSAIKCDESAG